MACLQYNADGSIYQRFTYVQFHCRQGVILPGFVLVCELFSAERRTIAAVLAGMYWSVAMVLLSAIAYFIHHWRHLVIVTSIPGLFVVPLFWLVIKT